jgi:hypothetical protein
MKYAVVAYVKVLSHENVHSNAHENDGLPLILSIPLTNVSSRLYFTSTLLEYRIYLKIMVHDLSWEVDSCSVSQEILHNYTQPDSLLPFSVKAANCQLHLVLIRGLISLNPSTPRS